MRIVVAPNAFKGSLTALQAAEAIRDGILAVLTDAEIVLVPIADGGDGTVDALVAATGGERRALPVRGPLGEPVEADYGLLEQGQTAVIEMAKASGLSLLPPSRRNPAVTTTYGVGELLQHAYDAGARRFIVGIGGSATNDGGAGMAQALGYHLLDDQGHELPPGGLALQRLARIDPGGVHADWKQAGVDVACDVTNPLTGPSGASAVYGPQKGATPELVAELDRALKRLAEVVRRDLGIDVEHVPGAGAAGGLGAGLVAFTGARLAPGAEMVMDALKLDERLNGASLVITGEGRLDSQTARFGKGPAAVARHARNAGIPVIGIGGSLADERELAQLFDGVESTITEPVTLDEALSAAHDHLRRATSRLIRILLTARRLP
ncbi:MAG: glycerate kinase [Chloroflexi bacterium]|nr:MAG: glycerate kinase [Chloroflexota bacterium]TME44562.1 MAG: glycerate kinase [Chloroflexota bacterium]